MRTSSIKIRLKSNEGEVMLSQDFERLSEVCMSQFYGRSLTKRGKIAGVKEFDLVSKDLTIIRDAKRYFMRANGGRPHGKLEQLTREATCLMQASASTRFLVIADLQVAQIWARTAGRNYPQVSVFHLSLEGNLTQVR